jgi:2-C-methyl-D-erythritol 4-phosphate cytidylyltransferase
MNENNITSKLSVIIVAGGSSRRYGNGNKLLEMLSGMPIFLHSVKKFLPMCMEKGLVMVVPKDEEANFKEITKQYNIDIDAIIKKKSKKSSNNASSEFRNNYKNYQYDYEEDFYEPRY